MDIIDLERDTGHPVAASHISIYQLPEPENEFEKELHEFLQSLPKSFNIPDDFCIIDEAASGIGWVVPDPTPINYSPKSKRSGTVFDNESEEMRAASRQQIMEYLGADVSLDEMRHQRTGYHTDLVYVDVDEENYTRRKRLFGEEPIHENLQRFKIWWWLYEQEPVTYDEATNDGLYSKPSKNRRHLDWLIENGWVGKTDTSTVTPIRPPSIGDIHAVELKIRDWETALKQAARANRNDMNDMYENLLNEQPRAYRDKYGYADYRWVALDARTIPKALKHKDKFTETGVGLLGIAEGGTVIELIEAKYKPRGRYTRDRAWIESEAFAKLSDSDNEPNTDTNDVSEPSHAQLDQFS